MITHRITIFSVTQQQKVRWVIFYTFVSVAIVKLDISNRIRQSYCMNVCLRFVMNILNVTCRSKNGINVEHFWVMTYYDVDYQNSNASCSLSGHLTLKPFIKPLCLAHNKNISSNINPDFLEHQHISW